MGDLEQGVLLAYLVLGESGTQNVYFKYASQTPRYDFLAPSKARKLDLTQGGASNLLDPLIALQAATQAHEYEPFRTSMNPSCLGAILWQDGLSQVQLLLTADSQTIHDPPCRAFVLELGSNLYISSVARLPVHTGHPMSDFEYNPGEHTQQPSLAEQIRKSWPGASLCSISGRTFATASLFYRQLEETVIVDSTVGPGHEPMSAIRQKPDTRYGYEITNTSVGGICCRKQPGDRDFSMPMAYGKRFLYEYQPSSDWYTASSNLPANGNGGMPSSITYLSNSSRIFALFPSTDARMIRLGVTSTSTLENISPSNADTRWSFITLRTPKKHYLTNVTAIAVQPPFPDSKPMLYLFCVDTTDDNPGQLWYSQIQLQGYEGLYGDLDIEPGTLELDLDNDGDNNVLSSMDSPKPNSHPVMVDSRVPIKAIQVGQNIHLYFGYNGQIAAYMVALMPDGYIYDRKNTTYKNLFRQWMVVVPDKAELLGACVVPAKFFKRW